MTKTIRIAAMCMVGMAMMTISACQHSSLEDRAEKDAKDFTERYCPTPVQNMQRTDSITFDKATHTFSYYYTLTGDADSQKNVNTVRSKIQKALIDDLIGNTASKAYKEQGYNYHYVFRSETTKAVLFETTLTKKDYQQGH